MFVIYGKNYLIEFGADATIYDIVQVAFTEHCNIVVYGKVLDVGLRRFMATVLCLNALDIPVSAVNRIFLRSLQLRNAFSVGV